MSNRLLFGFHSIIAVSGPPIIESLCGGWQNAKSEYIESLDQLN